MNTDVSKFLVTTADRRTWRKGEPILFLGEWCCWGEKKAFFESFDAAVASPYGWLLGQKEKDELYLQNLNMRLLAAITKSLNSIHNTEHSERYWRILLGTWLYRFTLIVFNRWSAIQKVVRDNNICSTIILDIADNELIPNDYLDFARISRVGDWDHAIYAKILRDWTDVECETLDVAEISRNDYQQFTKSETELSLRYKVKRVVGGLNNIVSKFFSRSTDAFIISPCLSRVDNILLHLHLKQIPIPWVSPPTPNVDVDIGLRKSIGFPFDCHSDFENFLTGLILEQIPICYLEGYKSLVSAANSMPWPKTPKVIFTANQFDSDEIFKVWTASKVDIGIPYVIAQHGGNYGTGLYAPSEIHERETSDVFLTWGWEEKSSEKYQKSIALPYISRKKECWDKDGGLLLVERGGGTRTFPWDETHLYKKYLSDQISFYNSFSEQIRKQITVRLYKAYLYPNWSEEDVWKEHCPDANLDPCDRPLDKLIEQNRLTVYTYNSTDLLGLMTLNVPCIFVWDVDAWPLRPAAEPYFAKLAEVGIFHDSYKEAAEFIQDIWGDVSSWWKDEKLQAVRFEFCDRFASLPENPLSILKSQLLSNKIGHRTGVSGEEYVECERSFNGKS